MQGFTKGLPNSPRLYASSDDHVSPISSIANKFYVFKVIFSWFFTYRGIGTVILQIKRNKET